MLCVGSMQTFVLTDKHYGNRNIRDNRKHTRLSLPREWHITCFLLRRLGAEVVKIMGRTALPVRPGHKRSSTRPLSWACACHYILISSSRLEPVFSVNLLNLSLWKMSHPFHKEFQYSHILSNILAHGVELIITRKSFFKLFCA